MRGMNPKSLNRSPEPHPEWRHGRGATASALPTDVGCQSDSMRWKKRYAVQIPGCSVVAVLAGIIMMAMPSFAAGKDVRGTFDESKLKRELKAAREVAFSPWMSVADAGKRLTKAELDHEVILALEKNVAGQMRYLSFTPKDGKGGDSTYDSSLTQQELLEKHSIWERQGYNILFVQKIPTPGKYCAVWVESAIFGEAVKRSSELGITPAQIRLETKPDKKPAPAASVVVTAPLRSWKDKSGREMEASLEGLEPGTAKFKMKDGRRFDYKLADLSAEDQSFLDELAKKAASASNTDADTPPEGFSKWMPTAKFETAYAEERGKGNYAIYIESGRNGELRAVFDKRPANFGWFMTWDQTEPAIREKNASYNARGMALLSLFYDRRSKKYTAVWVKESCLPEAKSQLASHGITPAEIAAKITPSTVRKE